MLILSTSEQKLAATQRVVANGQASNFSQFLEKAKSDASASAQVSSVPSSPNLENLTTNEAYDVLSGLAKSGKLTPEEYQTMAPTVYLRALNEGQGSPQPERFDLLSGVQSLIENSKMIGRYDQVRAQTHGLELLKAYQTNS
ncbi:hypothetical protein [Chromobacterium vaccinii]|uniref:hypothetical protein n=1 Tax=Chromobacterium vaccinii TaxID=1108595 RepID=UPI0011AB3010|nr:hypothetical protein [Chromobacterium vaccinii]